jgi:hypothetical protein
VGVRIVTNPSEAVVAAEPTPRCLCIR